MQAHNQNFSGQGKFFVEPGHFNKHFVKNTLKKKDPQGNILEYFLQYTIKATFWIDNLAQKWTK